ALIQSVVDGNGEVRLTFGALRCERAPPARRAGSFDRLAPFDLELDLGVDTVEHPPRRGHQRTFGDVFDDRFAGVEVERGDLARWHPAAQCFDQSLDPQVVA